MVDLRPLETPICSEDLEGGQQPLACSTWQQTLLNLRHAYDEARQAHHAEGTLYKLKGARAFGKLKRG